MAIFRDKPPSIGDNFLGGGLSRGGRYGEGYVASITNKELYSADEGSYFVASSPTAGTGIIGHAAPTTFDEAKPYLVVYNGGSNRIYPQYITLTSTVAGIGGVGVRFTMTLDTGNRVSSAGTAATVSNVNMDNVAASGAVVTQGAVVGTAATASRRLLGSVYFRPTLIDIIGDTYTFVFGASSSNGPFASSVATIAEVSRVVNPVVIGPGQSFCITQWRASQSTGPTFELQMGFIER